METIGGIAAAHPLIITPQALTDHAVEHDGRPLRQCSSRAWLFSEGGLSGEISLVNGAESWIKSSE
jgi:hypothetical protein